MDNELFELCKQVYEKTGWEVKSKQPFDSKADFYTTHYIDGVFQTYIYNSDFLLHNLPEYVQVWKYPLADENRTIHYEAVGEYGIDGEITVYADTPLKALLKLTLALKEAGEM